MKVKTYYGTTLQDALNQAKEELGEDVVVIETKEIKGGGLLLDNRSLIKLTVGVEEKEAPPKRKVTEKSAASRKEVSQPLTDRRDEYLLLKRQLDRLFNYFKGITNLGFPAFCERMWARLTELGMEYSDAIEFVQRAYYKMGRDGSAGESEFREHLKRSIVERIKGREGNIEQLLGGKRVVALVGPTGSGKTTIAMSMCLSEFFGSFSTRYLVTTDVYRIGSPIKLERFAKVTGVSFSKIRDPEELNSFVKKVSEGLVIVDTPIGRPDSYQKLYECLMGIEEMYTIVSVPVTMYLPDVQKYLESLDGLKNVGIALTKVDETAFPGNIVSLINSLDCSVYFLTDGVEIPESLKVMKGEDLVEKFFGLI